MRRGILPAALAILLLPFIPARVSSQVGYENGIISGVALAAGTNKPVEGTTIIVESDAGEVLHQGPPEGQGRFLLNNMRRGILYVTVRAPGYREARERVDLFTERHANIRITLYPDGRGAPPEVIPRGTVSASQLAVPEAARKEFEKGRKLIESRKAEKSISFFEKAIELYPAYAAAHLYLGMAQMEMRHWDEAEASLGRAIETDEKLAAAHLMLGTCHNMQGEYTEAEKPLVRGLELNPETADGQVELAKTYWSLGRWQDAEPHARKALELRSEFPTAHLLLGNILLRKRDGAAALKEFREYLRLDPHGPFVAQTRDVVAKLEQALGVAR
jgi:tetratricopeptide (TPR) repeat protein